MLNDSAPGGANSNHVLYNWASEPELARCCSLASHLQVSLQVDAELSLIDERSSPLSMLGCQESQLPSALPCLGAVTPL